jgi:hypothetical protein
MPDLQYIISSSYIWTKENLPEEDMNLYLWMLLSGLDFVKISQRTLNSLAERKPHEQSWKESETSLATDQQYTTDNDEQFTDVKELLEILKKQIIEMQISIKSTAESQKKKQINTQNPDKDQKFSSHVKLLVPEILNSVKTKRVSKSDLQ